MKLELDMMLREEIGMERGIAVGFDIARQIFKLSLSGKSTSEIASELSIDEATVRQILE